MVCGRNGRHGVCAQFPVGEDREPDRGCALLHNMEGKRVRAQNCKPSSATLHFALVGINTYFNRMHLQNVFMMAGPICAVFFSIEVDDSEQLKLFVS